MVRGITDEAHCIQDLLVYRYLAYQCLYTRPVFLWFALYYHAQLGSGCAVRQYYLIETK